MQQQVPKGLATWAGIIAAVGQYAAAIAVFLEAPDKALALGPLATATVTLITVVIGRMEQAKAQTEATASVIASSPSAALEAGDPDALPEYETEDTPPPDEGDAEAKP